MKNKKKGVVLKTPLIEHRSLLSHFTRWKLWLPQLLEYQLYGPARVPSKDNGYTRGDKNTCRGGRDSQEERWVVAGNGSAVNTAGSHVVLPPSIPGTEALAVDITMRAGTGEVANRTYL